MPPFLRPRSNVHCRAAPQVSRRSTHQCPGVDSPLETAVANFFTPTSQKPKDRTIWSQRAPNDDVPATLLVGRYQPDAHDGEGPLRRKIAAFDLDSTLIATSSGKKHAGNATDWKWWDSCVPGRLRELYHDQGYRVVILSNQGGLTLHLEPGYKGPTASAQKRVGDFKQKCSAVLGNLDLPTSVYAATGKDMYRKPRLGMWKEVCDDYDLAEDEVDLANSFFVGDAGGRMAGLGAGSGNVTAVAKDFSCSDRNLAHNVGIAYKTPEEFFLGQKPRDFHRDFDLAHHPFGEEPSPGVSESPFEKKNERDIVLCCGPPGAGKSTFYRRYLKPLGYERVNQDTLKSRDKCVQAARELVAGGSSVVVGSSCHASLCVASWGLTEEQTIRTLIPRCVRYGWIWPKRPSCRSDVFGSGLRCTCASTTTPSALTTRCSTRRRGKAYRSWPLRALHHASRSPRCKRAFKT